MADQSSSLVSASGGTRRRYQRSKGTRASVRVVDLSARLVIAVGGIGTILAVCAVFVVLAIEVAPLFWPASLAPRSAAELSTVESSAAGESSRAAVDGPAPFLMVDEYLRIGWTLQGGRLDVFRIDTGEAIDQRRLFDDVEPTAVSPPSRDGEVAFGFADGVVRLAKIGFSTSFIERDELGDTPHEPTVGDIFAHRGGIVEVTPEGQFRWQQLSVELQEPLSVAPGQRIELIDLAVSVRGVIFSVLADDDRVRIAQATSRKNLLTGKVTTSLREGHIEAVMPAGGVRPRWLKLAGLGDTVLLVWEDGHALRYDTRTIAQPVLAEEVRLADEGDARITSLAFLIGRTSLAVGDSRGRVNVWFRVKPETAVTPDGAVLVRAHALQPGPAAVAHLAASARSRMLGVGYADGGLRLFHVTSHQRLGDVAPPADERPLRGLVLGPKDDALVALTDRQATIYTIHAPHPEITLSSIFLPVWYEGAERPEHVWQSSSGEDAFEPKYGLYPLVFGTLKATFYSMLFGAPLAFLAAVYTSEFLHPRVKAYVKPSIEVMASLPSVVLGFLAALFFAPLVERVVPEMLTALATAPFSVLLGAFLWQLAPAPIQRRLRPYRLLALLLMAPAGLALAWWLGPLVERWFFAGDVKAWLDGQIGTGLGAWLLLWLPMSALIVGMLATVLVNPVLRRISTDWNVGSFALLDLVKFLVGCAAALLLALAIAGLLTLVGWDPRGSFVDTYVQRNALVVGFIMGFAIIPIIYTLSEDALSSVPESLRAGALGAGATEWQTAYSVVIPTAMSGLFSALMVGLGRAVGETMIVLMAAGNTPVMDWNIFNGFRTLSANIAVEMPEAVEHSTHFRMLFLAALTLFLMTFVVNSVAEVIRQRFRKRAFQL